MVTPLPHRRPTSQRQGPPRLRSLAAALLETAPAVEPGTPDAQLLDKLEDALAQLPSAERAAVMATYGYGEGPEAVAQDMGIDSADAEALTRNALQLLRGALSDVVPDERTRYPRLKRGPRNTKAPD